MTTLTSTDALPKQSLELTTAVRAVRTYWVGATAVLLAFVALAGLWTLTQPRVWTSTASGVVRASGGNDAALALAAENLSISRAKTIVELARSEAVASSAASLLDDDESAEALLARIAPSLADDSAIIEVTASGPTAERAQELADTWIAALSEQVLALENPDGRIASQSTTFVALAAATAPTSPASPNVPGALILGFLVGAVGAAVYVMIRTNLDRRLRSAAQVEALTGVAVIGTLVDNRAFGGVRQLASSVVPLNPADRRTTFAIVEGLRELRTNLSYVNVDSPPQSIVVVSASPAEGKSTIAANLAETIAASGRSVVLIDCDLRRPMQARIFGLEESVGLTDVLSSRALLGDVSQRVSQRRDLVVIGSGAIPPNPSELLGSNAMRELIEAVTRTGALVILDAPPVLAVTDGAVLSRVADGTIIVADTRSTKHDQLLRATNGVRRAGGTVIGIVLNRVAERGPDSQSYGYYAASAYYASKQGSPTAAEARPRTDAAAEEHRDAAVLRGPSTRARRRAGAKQGVDAVEPRRRSFVDPESVEAAS